MMCPPAQHQRGFLFERIKMNFLTDHAGSKMFAVPIIYITCQQRDKSDVKFGI